MVLRSICAQLVKDATNFSFFSLRVAIWSQFASDCLWASCWLSKGSRGVSNEWRVAMNKRFPRTRVVMQSVQRQVQTRFERKDAHNMQVLQDWRKFRLSRITLLKDPAELIRLKVHVFPDSTFCVGISNPDPSNKWHEVWNAHGFYEELNLAAREVLFIWQNFTGAHTIDIKNYIQNPLKTEQYRDLFPQCQRSGNICDTIQARTVVLAGASVREDVVERTSQSTSRTMGQYRVADG